MAGISSQGNCGCEKIITSQTFNWEGIVLCHSVKNTTLEGCTLCGLVVIAAQLVNTLYTNPNKLPLPIDAGSSGTSPDNRINTVKTYLTQFLFFQS